MPLSRRQLLTALSATYVGCVSRAGAAERDSVSEDQLRRVAAQPILQLGNLRQPVEIESIELLTSGGEYLVRVRSTDGGEGIGVANSARFQDTFPIFLNRVAPFFPGKDARDLPALLTELYRFRSNYKWQGLAFWVCVAAAELAILDLLGQVTNRSVGQMFGGIRRKDIAVYRASGNRGNTPEEEVDYLKQLLAQTGGDAVKFRLGGRMSNNRDSRPGRSEKLIGLARRELGPDAVLYADSNSSYDVPNAVRIGRLMQEHDYAFFEEPCPFDHLWETKLVTETLEIPVAGGEQEFSERRFRWSIANRVVDVVQPDLHYYGGFIRSARVARMANAAGMPCTAHMSGSGLGYLYVLHFASFVDDPGQHQEFKGLSKIPVDCPTSSLRCEKGKISVPTGPGFGVTIDPAFISRAKVVGVSRR